MNGRIETFARPAGPGAVTPGARSRRAPLHRRSP